MQILKFILSEFPQQKYPKWILFALILNVALAPAVYATSAQGINRNTAFAIGLLILVTLSLGIYLFAVILQPEKF
ncbi:K(+)-transporting ATPase subunit F [Calothrix sp. NIES-3974]|uniref:K(+)-transporting ATPase subunit F n=1 Tax=Calothrix sp. NIES-3974 TaxID=2005462 RepID=UPI001E2BA4BA|nr:K(+)-transporting ATPase subunit F [Calothrix sp. NIES-3974]